MNYYAGKVGSSGLDSLSGADVELGKFFPNEKFHTDTVSTHAPSDAIIVPDAHLLFTGDFKRSGVDLILSSGDRELVLHDYFKGEKRAPLASPDGAHLTGDIVNALTGHTQFAQADGSASVAPPVIGHVTKLTGNATAIRNGVSIVLNQGDTVHKGDVVQSGSDSTLGITFIDGTVFGLASNAKMVLNEMIYDPNGSDNKSLLSLVQGTISFVAGATAKKGDMKVDTPVATMGIRGTAVLVEIDFEVPGQGGAPPAKFQVLVEPDGTTGSYILFDKTTLTPIATVNRAGTQTIINGQGAVSFQSSVQLSSDAQKIITDVFSLKFSDLNNPNTKLTTNFTDSIVPESVFVKFANAEFIPVKLQFVNVPDAPPPSTGSGPTSKIDRIPGPPSATATGGDAAERIDTTASPAINSISGEVKYHDVNRGDVPSVSTQFSSFIYQDAQQADVTATLTAEQKAAIQAVKVPLVVEQDPNSKYFGTAIWTYNIADGAFDFLAAGEKLKLTYLARVDNNFAPFNETAFVPFTIVITGTNDKPTISSTGGGITERIGTGNTAIDTVSGTVTFADVDLTDRPVVSTSFADFKYLDAQGNDVTATLTPAQLAAILAVQAPLTVVQTAGNTHNGTATWTYSVPDALFDFIAKGETLVLNYVATVDDGQGGVVSTPISVSINGADVVVSGTNDVPVIDTTSNAFTEQSNAAQPNPTGSSDLDTVSGTISFSDVDLTDRPVVSAAFASFAYQNAAHVDVTATLTATQLAAIAAVDVPLTVVQAAGNTNNGSASWTYSVADSAFDFLADGEILTLTYTATVDDGHGGIVTKPLTVTVTGTNDTVAITSAPQTGAITELADVNGSTALDTADGTITFTDADLTDTHAVTIVDSFSASGVTTGWANGTVPLSWLSLGTLADSTDGVAGSQSWTFSAPDYYFDYLADSETVTLTYTVEIDDLRGGIATQQIAITITGANDAPEVAADVSGSAGLHAIAEQAGVTGSNDLDTATGSLSFSDVDLSDTHTFASSEPTLGWFDENGDPLTLSLAQEGVLKAASVFILTPVDSTGTGFGSIGFSYSAADNVFDFLAAGETLTITYDVTVTDEHNVASTQPVKFTVTGANDAPTLADVDAGTLADTAGDDTFGNLTGLLAGIDLDNGETATLQYAALDGGVAVNSAVMGFYGSLTVNASGGYVYVPDAALINALTAGTYTDTFTVQTIDAHGAVGTAEVTVNVTGVNDAPLTSDDIASIDSDGGSVTGHLLVNDTDAEGDTLSVSSLDGGVTSAGQITVEGVYGDLVVDTATGGYTYTLGVTSAQAAAVAALGQGVTVQDEFTYTASDGTLGTDGHLKVAVTGVNQAPTLSADSIIVEELGNDGVTTVFGIQLSDDDQVSDLTVTAAALHGGVSPVGPGTVSEINAQFAAAGITYTPTDCDEQTPLNDIVTITATDNNGQGLSDTLHFVFQQSGPGGATLVGTNGKDSIFSTEGDDELTGGAGHDNFVFAQSMGHDIVTDFVQGQDHIDLTFDVPFTSDDEASFQTWANSSSHVVQQGADTLITFDASSSILLQGVTAASLRANDFILHPAGGAV